MGWYPEYMGNLIHKYISQVLRRPPQAEHYYREVIKKEQALILMHYEWDRYTKTTAIRAMRANTGIAFGNAVSTLTLSITHHDIIRKINRLDLEWTSRDNESNEDIGGPHTEHKEGHFKVMESTPDIAKETRESPTKKDKSGNIVAHGEHTVVTDFAEPLFPWELTRRVVRNIVTEVWSRPYSMWVPVATNLKEWVTKGLQAVRIQSMEEGETELDAKDMTDKLQDHKKEKRTDPKRRDDKLQVDDNKKEKQMNDTLSEEANTKDPQRTDEMALVHPATTSLLENTNLQNKRAADELEEKLKRTRVHPRVTTQPKGQLMIKGEGWASSDGTDTNGGKWTPCPEKIIRKPGSMIENNKQTKAQASNKNKEHNRMETIHRIETLQKGEDSKRLASKLESQDSNTWVTHKMKREEKEDQMDSEENQEEEAERYDGKE